MIHNKNAPRILNVLIFKLVYYGLGYDDFGKNEKQQGHYYYPKRIIYIRFSLTTWLKTSNALTVLLSVLYQLFISLVLSCRKVTKILKKKSKLSTDSCALPNILSCFFFPFCIATFIFCNPLLTFSLQTAPVSFLLHHSIKTCSVTNVLQITKSSYPISEPTSFNFIGGIWCSWSLFLDSFFSWLVWYYMLCLLFLFSGFSFVISFTCFSPSDLLMLMYSRA